MPSGAAFDLFIGLVFLYLLLSLIASCVQEMVAGVFAWRGIYLSKGIDVILDNRRTAGFRFDGVRDWLVAHFTPRSGETVADAYRKVGPPLCNPVLKRVLEVQAHPLLRSNPTTLPSYVSARNFSTAFLGVLRDGSQAPPFVQVEATIAALPEGDLKKTLSLFAQDAAGEIEVFRRRLEQWFDDAMDRVAGAYRRLTQYVMLCIGFVLAASLNVNTPHVVALLWQTPSLRTTIVAQASRAVAGPPGAATDLQGQVEAFETQHFPVGWACWEDEGMQARPSPGGAACPNTAAPFRQGDLGRLARYVAQSLPGWIMTAIAISLGAPFWFDLLQGLVNVRNAGTKPTRSEIK